MQVVDAERCTLGAGRFQGVQSALTAKTAANPPASCYTDLRLIHPTRPTQHGQSGERSCGAILPRVGLDANSYSKACWPTSISTGCERNGLIAR
jgi:hypothetical protein